MNKLLSLSLVAFLIIQILAEYNIPNVYHSPIYGNATLGYFYINLYVGEPAQQQSVIIDTGSGHFAFPCSKCVSCGPKHINPPFNIKKSKTNKILTCASSQSICRQSCSSKSDSNPCTFSVSYAEGSSLSGVILKDYVKFQNNPLAKKIQTNFGCTTKQTNLFFTQEANGIFGLAPKRNNDFLDRMFQTSNGQSQVIFSICLSNNGGQLTFGGTNNELNLNQNIVKTTFEQSRNVYTLNHVGQVKINNAIIRSTEDLGYYGMFIDSGSTFTYFQYQKLKKLQRQLQNLCALNSQRCLIAKSGNQKNCFKITPKNNDTIKNTIKQIFSPIEITINGQIIGWTADKYFVLRSLRNREICLAVYGLDRFLLGGNWMQNMNIAFNLKEKTITIHPEANCKKKINVRRTQTDSGPQVAEHDQLPVYNGDNQSQKGPLEYFKAIFHEDDYLVTKIIGLILVIVLLFVILFCIAIRAGKNSSQSNENRDVGSREEDQRSQINITVQSQSQRRPFQQSNSSIISEVSDNSQVSVSDENQSQQSGQKLKPGIIESQSPSILQKGSDNKALQTKPSIQIFELIDNTEHHPNILQKSKVQQTKYQQIEINPQQVQSNTVNQQ